MTSHCSTSSHQTLPLFIRNSSAVDDIVVQTNPHTTSDTVVQAAQDVVVDINSLMASDRGHGNRLTAVEPTVPPLVGIEGAVVVAQSSLHPTLYNAAVEGNVELLNKFLQSQDLQNLDGTSPVDGVTIGDNTILHIAATSSRDLTWQGKGDYVNFANEVYMRNRSLLMVRNRLKETPLHCAAKAGNYAMVSLLISFAEHQVGEETLLTARNMHGETALHEAVRVGHRRMVEELIKSEPSLTGIVDAEGISPLYLATMMNMLNIVKIFTREDPSMVSCGGPKGQTAFHAAVLEHAGITHALLEWNRSLAAMVDDSESTPLHYAASVGNLATVKLLLQHEKSAAYMADKDGLFPIHIAAKCGRALLIKELIEQFPDSDELLDKEGRNFLHLAIVNGKGNIVGSIRHNRTFLRMLNARDYQGNTSLHLAGKRGEYRIVKFLISMKMVYCSIMNRDGLTPVDIVIKEVHEGFRKFTLRTEFHIVRCLLWIGALPSPRRFDQFRDDLELPRKDIKREIKKLENTTRNSGVISVLTTTVTFAAIFTMPGGYIADDQVNRGTPILSQKYAFKAFIVADLLAFLFSILATTWLLYAASGNVEIKLRIICLELSIVLVEMAGKSTICAFALAIYTMLYQVNLRISILVCVASLGILPFSNPACWGVLLLAPPIVKRVGWKGLFKTRLRPQTWSRINGVSNLGRNFSDFIIFSPLVLNISLYGLIFLLARL